MALAAVELLPPRMPRERLPYDAAALSYRAHADTYATLARTQGADRVWIVNPYLSAELAPKLAGRYGVRAVDDYEAVTLRRQAEYFTYAADGSVDVWHAGHPYVGLLPPPRDTGRHSPLALRRRLLDLAAVRLVAVHESLLERPEIQAFVADAGLVPRPAPGTRMALFENPRALPRAFAVYRTRAAPPAAELLERLSAPGFDPRVESYVEGDPGLSATPQAPARGVPATFVRDEERLVELDATLAAPGLLVLADSSYPGWRATVDGRPAWPASILTTNHLFRGVPVPAGRRRVRFEYRPWTVPTGAAVSLATAGVLLVLLCARRFITVSTIAGETGKSSAA